MVCNTCALPSSKSPLSGGHRSKYIFYMSNITGNTIPKIGQLFPWEGTTLKGPLFHVVPQGPASWNWKPRGILQWLTRAKPFVLELVRKLDTDITLECAMGAYATSESWKDVCSMEDVTVRDSLAKYCCTMDPNIAHAPLMCSWGAAWNASIWHSETATGSNIWHSDLVR